MTKPRVNNPRWLWILSLVVGGICAGAFGFAMLSEPDPRETKAAPPPTSSPARGGFGLGLAIGLGAGIVIGLAIARNRTRSSSENYRGGGVTG